MGSLSTMGRCVVVAAALVVLVSACGNTDSALPANPTTATTSSGTPSATVTSDADSSVSSMTTATAADVSTSTRAQPDVTEIPVVVEHLRLIESAFGSSGPVSSDGVSPDGSGCSPGSDVLPDGLWFVSVAGLSGATASFDLMCRYSGDAAFAHDEYVGGDYIYVNSSPKIRDASVGEGATVWLLGDVGRPDSQRPLGLLAATAAIAELQYQPYTWAMIEDGLIVELWEPWDS